MRSLVVTTVLAVIGGCQAYPLNRPQESASRTSPLTSKTSETDLVPCAATLPAATPAPEQEPSTTLPQPRGIEPGTPPVPLTANGQPPLTLVELEQLALSRNPTIPQAGALVQQQMGLMRQVGLYPNPQAGYLRTDADQSGQSQTDGVFLSQEVVTAGKLRLARQAERQDVQLRKWQLSAQERRVFNDLRIRFYEVLGAQRAAEAARELVELAERGVESTQKLLESGQGSRPDLLQAKIQLSALRTALKDAEYRHHSAWEQMANIVGVSDLPPAPLAGSLNDDIPDLNEKESLQRLLATSPLLKAQEAAIRASQVEVRLARAQAVPNVNVQVVAQRDHVMKYSNVSTLIAMPIPMFNRNQGGILNAEGILRQQQKEYERIRLALIDQLAASFRQYRSLRNQTEQLEKEILPWAKENLELTTEGYKLGRFHFQQVLSARQTYFQTNMAYIDALTELHKVVVEIEGLQLTGGLNPTEVGTALQTTPGAGTTSIRGVLLQQLQEQAGKGSRNLPGAIQGAER